MKKIKEFVAERGLTVMLCGMGIAVAGVIVSMVFKHYEALYAGTVYPRISAVIVFLGAAVYFIGRVSHSKMLKRHARNKILDKKEAGND